ncbi:MAG: hypothetical protein QOD75_917 [Blastocatellia bacterium]|nr:hypothetical protein [Blastocatellia bacterium]
MEKRIPLKELEENVSLYASRVERGESFVIIKRSKPIFRISPITAGEEQWEEVVDITKIRKGGVEASEVISRL